MKSHSRFDLVTVLISKQRFFFQHRIWPVEQGKSYLDGIVLLDILHSKLILFQKKSKQARVPTFVCLFRDNATTAKGSGCDKGTNLH